MTETLIENKSPLITELEAVNSGNLIYLYHKNQASVWSAYGPSAYALRLYTKINSIESLRSFNKNLELPRTTISDMAYTKLLQTGIEIIDKKDKYILFKLSQSFPWDDYLKWCERLQYEATHPELIFVETPVSRFVPKDRFISDGMSSFSRQIKRCGDFLLSAISIVIFSPLFLYCYIAVKKEDKGPALFRQERIGRFGKPFNILKFRTMKLDAEKFGPQLSHSGGNDDPRLTKIGKFLRSHHLDELPQLWNVFRGDMAFIGPRPERQFYIDQILEHDKRYAYLYQIRPGVTSYATLYNGYTDTMEKMLRRLEYDLYYLGHRSWWFDAKILWNTFRSIVFGKKF